MSIARVSSKGQITLPVRVREAAGIKPGDRVRIEVVDARIVVDPVGDFLGLKGFLGKTLSRGEERSMAMLAAASRSARKG